MHAAGKCSHAPRQLGFCSVCELREQSLCAELSDEEMRLVSQTMAHLSIKEGQTVFAEGEPSEFFYVVVSGAFRLVRLMDDGRRQITGFAFPGDFVGMGAPVRNGHSCEALEPSLVCRFSHAFLEDAAQRHPGIKDRLIARGQTELHKAEDHIMLLGKQSAEARVLAFLEMIAARKSGQLGGVREVYLPMSRQDIADYLGLRLETLSRTLGRLRDENRLTEVRGRVIALSA